MDTLNLDEIGYISVPRPAGPPIPDRWSVAWETLIMPAPAFAYFDTCTEAWAFIRAHRADNPRCALITRSDDHSKHRLD